MDAGRRPGLETEQPGPPQSPAAQRRWTAVGSRYNRKLSYDRL